MEKAKKRDYLPILMAITAIGITVTAIVFKQLFLNILPLYISLFVWMFQSKLSRYAFVVGAVNALLYAFYYFRSHLYVSAIYAVLFSFVMQVISYFMWKRRPSENNSTVFRSLTKKQIILGLLVIVAVWLVIAFFLSKTDSKHQFLDVFISILGILGTFLCMLAYAEYVPVSILTGVVDLILSFALMLDNKAQSTYFIFNIYSLICRLIAMKNMKITIKKQREKLK